MSMPRPSPAMLIDTLPKAQQAARSCRTLLSITALAVLVACGGGRDEGTAQASAAGTQTMLTLADGSSVSATGEVTKVSGYLAQSQQVLRASASASVTVTLKPATAGRYELLAWWPQQLTDAGTVSITVNHRDGRTEVQQDQRSGGGQWQSLGTYEFDPAVPASLTWRSASGTPFYVDGVQLRAVDSTSSALAFKADKLPSALRGEPYQAQLEIQGGRPGYTFTVEQGRLPNGLSLNTQSGEITGRATEAGLFSITIAARDGSERSTSQTYTLLVDESAATASVAAGLPPTEGPSKRTQAVAADGTPDLSNMLTIVAGMAPGEWRKVSLNAFSDVWTPEELRPLYMRSNPTPDKIISSWSGFAWDSKRAAIVLYGGGHANYRGNDVYMWRASTQRWERAALPSEMAMDAQGYVNAIDGYDKAPAAAHTYDSTIYLPLLDKVLVVGGAADPNGGHYVTTSPNGVARSTGPYLFDPARADGNKVGGTTGSHVKRVAPHPEVVGGNMWSNREAWLNATAASKPPTETLANGCSAYAEENGKDVVYLRTASWMYRYVINDINNPAADSWTSAARYYYGSGEQTACGFDAARRIFVAVGAPGSATPFVYWNLTSPSGANLDNRFTPTDLTGEFTAGLANGSIVLRSCGLKADPRRNDFKLWCGGNQVFSLKAPSTLSPTGWTISKLADGPGAVNTDSIGYGILGKWKYIPNLDVFMSLSDPVLGNVWIYKPQGWVNPVGTGNLAPSVSLSAPTQGQAFTVGSSIGISASAADGDGNVVSVDFYDGSTKIGTSTSAPYGMVWTGATTGSHTITAVATDNAGATKTSTAVTVTVNPVVVPNVAPTIALALPSASASVIQGTTVTLAATAVDSDGSIAKVEFFAGGSKIGEALAAPYTFVWTTAPVGSSVLTAVATDDRGATTTSDAVTLTVTAATTPGTGATTTVTLQRGVGTAQVADLYLSGWAPTSNLGTTTNLEDQYTSYSTLLRFAIFQSEGGPVPNGATITSAVLSLYKYSIYNMTYELYPVLVDWSESTATWKQRLPGVAWTTAGANGSGSDYAAAADATVTIGWDAAWLNFDITRAVQGMSSAPSPANRGWRMIGTTGYTAGSKKFYTSEFATTPTLRPKLVITYQ